MRETQFDRDNYNAIDGLVREIFDIRSRINSKNIYKCKVPIRIPIPINCELQNVYDCRLMDYVKKKKLYLRFTGEFNNNYYIFN